MIELIPSGVTTVMSTVPLPGVGGTAKMLASSVTEMLGEGVVPKRTAVAPLKPQPGAPIEGP